MNERRRLLHVATLQLDASCEKASAAADKVGTVSSVLADQAMVDEFDDEYTPVTHFEAIRRGDPKR